VPTRNLQHASRRRGAAILLGGALLTAALQAAPLRAQKARAPTHPSAEFQALAERADAARRAGRTEAIQLYQQALRLNPRWDEGWWYLGTLYYDMDQYREAQAAFRNTVELDPQLGPAYALLGLCEYETGDYKNALIHLQHSRTLGLGDNTELKHVAAYHLGVLLNRVGEFEAAKDVLGSLVTDGVESEKVKTALGMSLLHIPLLPTELDPSKDALVAAVGGVGESEVSADFNEATAGYEQLLKDYPNVPFLHYAYGSLLANLSRYPEAERQLQEEIRINPDSALPYMQLAYIALKEVQYAKALPLAEQGVKRAPQSYAAHYFLGRALLGAGNIQAAIKELETAERLGPYSPEVRYNLALAYARAKRKADALREQAAFQRLNTMLQHQNRSTLSASKDSSGIEPHQVQPADSGGPRRP
jgi:tetratricopeptide (TPR) repeat protein